MKWKKKEKLARGSWKKQAAEAIKKGQVRKREWPRAMVWLKTLKKKFKNISESKKRAKKMSKIILK